MYGIILFHNPILHSVILIMKMIGHRFYDPLI